jgi:UDP-2-acetamido-3-amino-2,3-dideoxy-glucuronate N-acetyltransferase
MAEEKTFWAHPSAIVDPGARIGAGTKIWHFSHISGNEVQIGENCSFGQNAYVGNKVKIGKGVRVQNNVSIYDLVELGDYVFCGPSAVFTNVINPRAHIPRKDEFKTTFVRQGVSLGANCTIVCGVDIGRFAFVAAGAVVTKNVVPFALVQGVPARQTGWMCHCGVKLEVPLRGDLKPKCSACASEYRLKGESLEATSLKNCFEGQ